MVGISVVKELKFYQIIFNACSGNELDMKKFIVFVPNSVYHKGNTSARDFGYQDIKPSGEKLGYSSYPRECLCTR